MSILRAQLEVWASVCAGALLFVWLVYVFAGLFGCMYPLWWGSGLLSCYKCVSFGG